MNQIIGNPVPFKVGRRTYLVGYVSMSEWQVYGELAKVNVPHAVLELIYYSLRRACPNTTRRGVKWWARRFPVLRLMVRICPDITYRLLKWWTRRHPMPSLVKLICKISLPKLKAKGATVVDTDAKDAERNIKTVYRLASRMHGWSPQQINDMSPVQIFLYSIGGPEGTGIVKMSGAEYQSFMARRRSGLEN